ncbi:protein unc-93 homolog A-like isoform X1 [Lepisosteus oculatus]|uniref:protein unc-93 homolog A-like isoform X1 n=1 Tax=Lepisosteus oculatus TaxID=7918 RepID=UPI0003EAC51A|nr:PREDICTED: protein unc-93 homolog A-like isoform X2 [Lepisosteus oculatus]XP_015199355.1 PREDICTED: protein unc-93 homolog A-like isoform X2 [Lepisosteus oculatus]XP_015199363.1 PREDICTED: protein unc-93 homolog A-like isoform X2 [Lepisosteus oculatus]XP_015199371.1 PREDICTED: protein unc-93 homolog A-like isoform X2 [Lepisosteus oculatus]XP_015199376.1 PREDICTED: protein unc-93 homolog A-like isoform X2 [Lepisosteus oculatus]XP_015199382.1 PREDICTED: protein unc-93 homolog A-like isoform X
MGGNMKNVLVVSFGFLLLFTAYGGLQSLQSSLNASEGMGVASLSVIYASIILSSMFLPPILIKNLGCKRTIVASMGCYVAYSFGNIYPGWPTMIITSVILGLGASPLWSAKCTYLTISGNMQAEKDNKRGPDVVNQYFGIFFLIFQSSAVWGNLMSSLIFGKDTEIAEIPKEDLKFCGAGSCEYSGAAAGNSTRPPDTLVYTLLGSYIGIGVLAMIFVAVFLDNLDRDAARELRDNRDPFWTVFLATFKHLSDKRQILLIPLTMYSGFEQGFLAGDYTKYYVTCALGIHFVGFVMICFGATNSLCSYAFGKLAQYTGRAALFGLAAVSNFSCIIALLLWKPHPDQLAVFFVFPALWGMADAVWQTQTNALYGILFHEHKEAAFANYRLWESVGFVIAFAYSNLICLDIKLYVLIGVLVVSVALYGLVEYKEYKRRQCVKESAREADHF